MRPSTRELRRSADHMAHDARRALIWINADSIAIRADATRIGTPETSGIRSRRRSSVARAARTECTTVYTALFSRDIRALCFAIIGMSTRADYNHEITRLQIEKNIVLFCVRAYAIAALDSNRGRCRHKKQIVFDQPHCSHPFARKFAENIASLRVFSPAGARRSHRNIGDLPVERAYPFERRRSAYGAASSPPGLDESTVPESCLFLMTTCDPTASPPAHCNCLPDHDRCSDRRSKERHFPYASAWPKRHADNESLLQAFDSKRIDRPARAVMRSNPLRVPRPRPTGSCNRRASR